MSAMHLNGVKLKKHGLTMFIRISYGCTKITKNGLRTIKRVNDKGKNIQLIPDNKDYQEQFIPKEELLHVFVVKGCMKAY